MSVPLAANGTDPPQFRECVALITGARFPSSIKYSLYLYLFTCVHATLEPCTHIYMYLHPSIHPSIRTIQKLPTTAPAQMWPKYPESQDQKEFAHIPESADFTEETCGQKRSPDGVCSRPWKPPAWCMKQDD